VSSYMNGELVTFDGGEVLTAGGQFNDFTRMSRETVKSMMEMMKPDKK